MTRQLSDWLEYYLEFTQNGESPTQYHLWSGITAIASCLRRKCYSNWGMRGYVYPNLYVVLVGPPGGRKGTAMRIVKSMLFKLDLSLGSDALGSTQALYREIQNTSDGYKEFNGTIKEHKSLSIWSEEFQVFLNDRDPFFIGSLTDLFDCADVWKYSTIKRGADDLSNCWLTIIGAITPSLLQSKLTKDAIGGGLVSRIIFVVGYGFIKKVALPFLTEHEMKLEKMLQQDLEQISLLSGPFKLEPDFLHVYTDWYENSPAEQGVDSDKFLGYNSRRALHLNKLCMIISASENDEMRIQAKHFKKALAILEEAEHEMPNAYQGYGGAMHSEVYAGILDYIEEMEQFSFQDLLIKFQLDTTMNDLNQYVHMMEKTGKVKAEHSATQTIYTVKHKKQEIIDDKYLKQTLYRRIKK